MGQPEYDKVARALIDQSAAMGCDWSTSMAYRPTSRRPIPRTPVA